MQKIKIEKRVDLRAKKKEVEKNCQIKNYIVSIVPQEKGHPIC